MFGEVPDLSLYYRVDAADDSLDELAAQLVKCTAVNAAYVKPPAYPSQQHAITDAAATGPSGERSEEHTSELQSLMRISYAVFCLKNKTTNQNTQNIKPPH